MYSNPNLELYLDFLIFVPSVLCFVLNGMLMWMIFMNRNKELGTYRYLLLTLVLTDLINTLIHLVIMPIPEIYNNAFILGAHSWWKSRASVCLSTVAFSLPYSVLSLNFLYRLVAVKHPFSLDSFKKPTLIAFLGFITVANSTMWFVIVWIFGFNKDANKHYVWDLFTGIDPFPTYVKYSITEIDTYSIFVYWEYGILDFNGFHYDDYIVSIIMSVSICAAYGFMGYASYAIIKHLREARNLSNRNHHQHVQLLRALLLQALTPLVTSYCPIACCYVLPLFGIDHPLFSVITPLFCAFHPVFDEIIMITTVSQFRNTVIDWVPCKNEKKHSRCILIENERKISGESGKRKHTLE